MLSVGSSVFISIPDKSREPILHMGKVIETDAEIFMAAELTARYCDLKYEKNVEVTYYSDSHEESRITVSPMPDAKLNLLRI